MEQVGSLSVYIKVIRPHFPWYSEASSRVTRNAIGDLDNAFKKFFAHIKARKKPGFPRFKKKDIKDSFALRERTKFDVVGRKLRLKNSERFSSYGRNYALKAHPSKSLSASVQVNIFFILVDTSDYPTAKAARSR